MKKFSFKKLITVSLFFTSVIFTSAFTTCFIPTISTSHSSDQPNATKIDLNDYNGKMLPNPVDRPDEYVSHWYKKMLLGQLKNAKGQTGWENWNCYLNQFELTEMAFNTDGGSFRIAAKTNAVNYVGSSTASIRFKYYLQTTLSTLIPNDSVLPIVVDYDLWTDTSLANRYLLRVLKQQYGLDINEITITPDYSSSTYNNPFAMLTIQSKPNSLVYSGSTTIKFQFYPYPYYVANYYEQAGCVAIYDANYNAGFGSHANGFDLQWRNLVDNEYTTSSHYNEFFEDEYGYDCAEIGGFVDYDSCFVTPYSAISPYGERDFTLEVVFQLMSQDNGLFFIGNCNGAEGFYFSIQPNPPHYISIREFRTPGSSPDLSDLSSRAFSASTTYSISLVSSYSEGWFAYYVNGELQQGRENEPIDFFEPQNETFWSIGIPETYEQYYFDPSVACQRNYCTRIYNRALTEDEVRYNWETDNYIYHIVP